MITAIIIVVLQKSETCLNKNDNNYGRSSSKEDCDYNRNLNKHKKSRHFCERCDHDHNPSKNSKTCLFVRTAIMKRIVVMVAVL